MRWNYSREAGRFGEADPIGNGHMGGMVYGGILQDRIDLSESTFFSGAASMEQDSRIGAHASFYQMREVLKQEKFAEARVLAEGFIGCRNNYGTNLPVGHFISELLAVESVDHTSYRRNLDFGQGIASSSFRAEADGESVQITRKVYASWPDKVMVYSIQADRPVSLRLSYQNESDHGETMYQEGKITFTTGAFESLHSDGESGTLLAGHILVQTQGRIIPEKNALLLTDATEITCLIGMVTDFGRKGIMLQTLKQEGEETLSRAAEKTEEELRMRHIQDIEGYMNRVELKLFGKEQELAAGLFQYGRYLLLCSSREDSLLPAHLQGIWNDNVACRIGWTCDMHLDINTQMNYWPSGVTNLREVNRPLFQWIDRILAPAGRYSAEQNYNLGGWIGEIVSNAWGFAAPYWASPIAPCPTGGVWILSHIWEEVLFTQDLQFLVDTAYPLIYDAAVFFKGYVFEADGYYSCGPSISPENSFLANGEAYQISNGCTYEILMIRELFLKLYEMEELMGNHSALGEEVHEIAQKLLPYRILEDGTIAEWAHGHSAADSQHRHTSHLLGLYPFSQITPEKTPELAEAARKTIAQKHLPEENWEDTGWARSMLMLYSARLQDGEACQYHISQMLHGLLEENHMIIHPPTRGAGSFANVYELDGNTGLTSCIAEMLLQSHDGVIRLLPALPEDWQEGSFKGLLARGGLETELEWKGHVLERGSVKGIPGTPYCLQYRNRKLKGRLPATGIFEFYCAKHFQVG